jgi:hypothetical protein
MTQWNVKIQTVYFRDPEICRKDVISKGLQSFYTNTGNGIKNTSIQINAEKG